MCPTRQKTPAFRRLIFWGGRSELWGLPELRSPQACKRMFPYRGSRKPGDPVRRKCVLVLQRSHFPLMSMRYTILALSAASLGILGCTENTTAPDPEVFHLSATVTASNTCAVTAMDKQYSSVNQVRGDLPDKFVGTVAGASWRRGSAASSPTTTSHPRSTTLRSVRTSSTRSGRTPA